MYTKLGLSHRGWQTYNYPKSTLVAEGYGQEPGLHPKSTLVAEGYGQRDVHEVGSFTQGLADTQLP